MSTLLIDAGNSSLKWTLLKSGVLSSQQRISYSIPPEETSTINAFQLLLKDYLGSCNSIVMVSVLGDVFDKEAQRICLKSSIKFRIIKSVAQLANIKNSYLEPHKLGTDRFVGMIAAYDLINNNKRIKKACIIVDSGTATTIDAIDSTGQHLGGLILPGLNLCSRSLLESTQLLPQWNKEGIEILPKLFAKETTEAITSASLLGLAGAIDSICKKMEKEIAQNEEDTNVEKILCGGAAAQLIPHMVPQYRSHPNLLMLGLKLIADNYEF